MRRKLFALLLCVSLLVSFTTNVYAAPFNTFSETGNIGTTTNKTIPFAWTSGSTKWIYVNYPEVITSTLATKALGDKTRGNSYLTRTTMSNLYSYELFQSFRNNSGININFGVQIYNGGTQDATVYVTKLGARNNNTGMAGVDVFGGAAKDFLLSNLNTPYTVKAGQSTWIYDSGVIPGTDKSLNVYLQFNSPNSNLTCFTYLYNTKSAIDGTATVYKWDGSPVYNGNAITSKVNDTNISINVSQMTSTPCVYRSTNRLENSGSDIISITDSDPAGRTFSIPNDNLANWGAHYKFNVTVTNDTSTSKTISAYVGTLTPIGNALIPVIKYGSEISYGKLVYNSSNPSATGAWKFITDTLPANTSKTYSYEFMYGSNSAGPVIWQWKAQ